MAWESRLPPPSSLGFLRTPLVPVAIAFTTGILLDRCCNVPLAGSLFVAVIALAAWAAAGFSRKPSGLALIYLGFATTALGAAYHHYRRDVFRPDDIHWYVEERPTIVELRGVLDDEPQVHLLPKDDPLIISRRRPEEEAVFTIVPLGVSHIKVRGAWQKASGRVEMLTGERLTDLHAGDNIEVLGRLEPLNGPENPGEFDRAAMLRDEGVRGLLRVQHPKDAIVRLERASFASLDAWRARVRGWGIRVLRDELTPPNDGLAAALLLGDNTLLAPADWDRYIRSGVIHVLVVSGQHLVILAAFLGFCLRYTPLERRTSLILIVLFLWSYALLAGGRPSVVRAAVTVSVFAGGLLLRRATLTLNALAAAWLLVLILNPADVNNTGCLLSFVCVAALYWNVEQSRNATPQDPLDLLVAQSRPAWQRGLLALGRAVLVYYKVSLLLWLVVTPLVVARLNFLPLMALAIGPPVIWLTTLALVFGFQLLIVSAICPPLTPLFAWLTSFFLTLTDSLVSFAGQFWQRQGYVSSIPAWWLIPAYLLLAVGLVLPTSYRATRLIFVAGVGWLCVLLATSLIPPRSDELRVTFLSVGHGGCTVLETPDGRVLLYDAGSMRGPAIVRRQLAPYLWSRGIRRIDELFLSHADLDHFNGVRDLLERFSIGRITCTPTFADKRNSAVKHVLDIIERHGVPVRIVQRGDQLEAGDVRLDVLHPPSLGPDGEENVRSMVLLVRHGRNRILLTGDLEETGLVDFTRDRHQRKESVDILMAPHHGSQKLDAEALMDFTQPRLVIACQAVKPDLPATSAYRRPGVRYLGTWPHGAITVRSHATGLIVETFVTGERIVLPARD